uniref:Neck appendage protein n=1 Tax=Siphoviridae sp. ctnjE5 TaxID=2826456 RepID=A0A8S5NGC4_9CAUD|nr:MAG TPA: Neck appendage protein [Siphoviridae sp. ctnjE5]
MNGDFTLTVKYPISDSGIYQLIQEDMLIKAPTPVLGAQLFRIKKPIEQNDHLEITAYHISDDVMQRSITPISVTSQSCGMALSRMVQNTKTALGDFSFNSDIQDRRTFNTTETETLYSVLLDGKHSIVGTWEGELVRDNFAMTVKKNRGENRGVVITTHKNLKDYQRTKNSQNVVTRIHAKSTFKPEGAEKETTIRVTVDSPLINSYPYINEKEYENNNAKTVEELQKWAQSKFSNEGIDKVSDAIKIEAYELDGQVVHMGDTVNLKSWKHNVDAFKKAIAYEFDALKEEYISLTFDDKAGTGGSRASGGLSSAADAILGVTESAQEIALVKALQNADLDFDHKAGLLRQDILDGIEQAKAKAEQNKRDLFEEIDNRFSGFDSSMNEKLEDQRTKIEEIRAIGSTVTQTAEEALEEARSALESANTSKDLSNSNFAKIDQITDRIKTLVTKQEVDPLTDRLRIAESRIEVQAGQIIEKLSRTDFDRLANDRGFQTATQVQNTVKHSVDGFQRTISRIETKLRDIIRNDNLLQNSSIIPVGDSLNGTWGLSMSGGNGRTEVIELRDAPHSVIKKGIRVVNNTNGGNKDIAQKINLVIGEKYTMSCWARVSSISTTQNVNLLIRSWTTNDNNRKLFKTISNKDWVRYQFTFTADTVSNSIQFGQSGSGSIEICGMKLEHSDRMTDYDVNSSEIVSVVEFNDVRDTVSSHTQTLQRQDQAISQVIQTADGLVSRVSNFLDDFNLVYDPTNFSKWTKKQPEANVIEVQADTRLLRITTTGKNQAVYHGFALPLNTSTFTKGEKLSYRMEVWVDVLPDGPLGIELWASDGGLASDRVYLTKTGTQIITGTMTVQKSSTKTREFPLEIWLMKNGQVAIGQVSLIRGDKPPKRFSDNTSTQDVVTQTQVSQLRDSYAIQTLTGPGAISSQINLNSNNILIEAAKIRLKGRTLLDEITAIDGYFKRLFVGDARVGTLNADIIRSNSISADKLIFDTALAKKLVASDVFTDTLAAKTAFINKLRSVVVSATLLEGYKGKIGGFQIGTHDKDPNSYWLTGQNQFKVGMGSGNGRWGQTALWVNWGNDWGQPGDTAWYVKNNGEMYCYNQAHFWNTPIIHGNLKVSGNIYYITDDNTKEGGYWIHSPSFKRIQESSGYIYLYRFDNSYSWIPVNKEISDRRYKHNIEDSKVSALEVINRLKTYSYRKEYDGKIEDISCGIMAQDVQKYAPEAFLENPDGAYSYSSFVLVPYLIKAIQELNQKLEKVNEGRN